MGVTVVQRAGNDRMDTLGIASHIIVPEAHDQIALRFDDRGPASIRHLVMLTSIHFNNEATAMTREIHDEVADGNLTAEARFGKAIPKQAPHALFSICGFTTQLTRALNRSIRRMVFHTSSPTTTITPTNLPHQGGGFPVL